MIDYYPTLFTYNLHFACPTLVVYNYCASQFAKDMLTYIKRPNRYILYQIYLLALFIFFVMSLAN